MARKTLGGVTDKGEPFVLGQHRHAERLRVGELRSRIRTRHDVLRLLRNGTRDLGAKPFGQRFRLISRQLRQRTGEDDGLSGNG